jgi:hemerythrin-like domain-containing protein
MIAKAFIQLEDEHDSIETMLKVLVKVTKKIEKSGRVPRTDLASIIDFLSTFVDKCHLTKEDDILFPELKNSSPVVRRFIDELHDDHVLGRAYIWGLRSALPGYKKGNIEQYMLVAIASSYIRLLAKHLKKENLFFLVAEEIMVGQGKEKYIENRFGYLERNLIGKGKHEEYHRLLDRLELKYLLRVTPSQDKYLAV